ncbi:class I SAM-dependent DNA methyltransferase [Allostreptomyces psammosilenae]|uniref:class I SAM-dependent DNA methyltransferase n=1 Tax=Allostreptomyces psammosilenae TaxID=1892865 RepID=UPI0015CE29D5|nr:class I SAM-dependent methyltransferase [Allostreptomyces psammosilenae]
MPGPAGGGAVDAGAPRPDRRGQAEAFDAIGDRYDEAFPHKAGQIAAGSWLAGELSPGGLVLDVGCGTGVPTARQLVDAGHRVVGVDISEGMLNLARKAVPEARFERVDIADLGRAEVAAGLGAPFDAATAFFSLLMLPRAEIPGALRTVHGLLRPGGLFALSMVEADVDYVPIPFLGTRIRVSGYLREELRALVEEAGFTVLHESAASYAPLGSDTAPEVQVFLHCGRR